ncbi:MAG TPA: endonuclease/exonuclease/phosphatase family protein [Fimbriimonadaceae bacterium]|nr:endonuclease/exonuclease/phosphatase family protein [Fimbriimonadaceae bacterium]
MADQTPQKKSWLWRLSIFNICFLLAIFFLGAYVAERTRWTTFVAYLPQAVYFIPLVILLIWALVSRRKKSLTLNLIAGAIFSYLLLGINCPHRLKIADEGPRFTLMTFNIKNCTMGWDRALATIRAANPDVICFQEANQMGALPPGYHLEFYSGKAIAAKERIIDKRTFPLTPGISEALEVKLESGLTVVSVQLASFSIGRQAVMQFWGLPTHMFNIARIHDREADILIQRYRGRKDTVIAGDFNCPPRGQVYNKLARSFNDSFVDSGWLTGFTYPSSFPLQRIDYAFTTDLRPQSARTLFTNGSDHCPVLFEFIIYRPT